MAQERAKLQEGELELSHQLAFAIRDLEANYVLSQTDFNRRIAAQREVEAVAAAYETDTVTLDVLLKAQQNLAQAESDYYRALVDYNKSIAQVHYRKGSLAGVQWRVLGRRAVAGQGVLRRPPPRPGPRGLDVPRLRLHAAEGHQPRADRADTADGIDRNRHANEQDAACPSSERFGTAGTGAGTEPQPRRRRA